MHEVIIIHSEMDLIYSPDDGGWYFHEMGCPSEGIDDRTSNLYSGKDAALRAYKSDSIAWDLTKSG